MRAVRREDANTGRQPGGLKRMDRIVELATKAIVADLEREGGEHGCLIDSIAPDYHACLRGHVYLPDLARAACKVALEEAAKKVAVSPGDQRSLASAKIIRALKRSATA
jgi:hypothetical protein